MTTTSLPRNCLTSASDDLARLEAWFDQAYLEDRIEEAEQRLARLKAIRQTVQQVSA